MTKKTILITGANSGLGKALALEYANEHCILYLTGRDRKRLQEIAKLCKEKGAQVKTAIIDVKDAKEFASLVDKFDKENPIDMVIANAGISAGTSGTCESYEQVSNIFKTNIDGVINTIHPIIEKMTARKFGQVVLISSLAGYRGLPSSPAYSASKAAVKVYGEGLRGALKNSNIKVTVVTPGYIKTPMTDVNNFPMPCLIEAEKAAKLIKRRLNGNPARIAFPLPFYLLVWFVSILPPFITDPIFAMLPGKPSVNEQKQMKEKNDRT